MSKPKVHNKLSSKIILTSLGLFKNLGCLTENKYSFTTLKRIMVTNEKKKGKTSIHLRQY